MQAVCPNPGQHESTAGSTVAEDQLWNHASEVMLCSSLTLPCNTKSCAGGSKALCACRQHAPIAVGMAAQPAAQSAEPSLEAGASGRAEDGPGELLQDLYPNAASPVDQNGRYPGKLSMPWQSACQAGACPHSVRKQIRCCLSQLQRCSGPSLRSLRHEACSDVKIEAITGCDHII